MTVAFAARGITTGEEEEEEEPPEKKRSLNHFFLSFSIPFFNLKIIK